ncbi:hypothetical protein [Pseudomonas aeruginosa]|uniref:PHIKZ239 n=1 Tax=Pseudomonas phage phiKZ TaxID=2905945 RepID=Q8SCS3_BPDPK|nr:hypothetical protein [Pseudomonas aeruginosa]NP_803805.1 PHIKZ239 [Pseudomonas phage phiKZ]AAL83140.1 PHIKZ239 [Pseudomonas phage phiKZ]MBW6070613.1 hypothetical protein [Pseudomonas aeruginosa]UXD83411.1 hypothetical protein NP274_00004 [Pseudomonas phage Koomba boorn-mokiny kep-wari Wadjak 2]
MESYLHIPLLNAAIHAMHNEMMRILSSKYSLNKLPQILNKKYYIGDDVFFNIACNMVNHTPNLITTTIEVEAYIPDLSISEYMYRFILSNTYIKNNDLISIANGTIQLSIKDNYELDRNILTDMFVLYSQITEPKEDF